MVHLANCISRLQDKKIIYKRHGLNICILIKHLNYPANLLKNILKKEETLAFLQALVNTLPDPQNDKNCETLISPSVACAALGNSVRRECTGLVSDPQHLDGRGGAEGLVVDRSGAPTSMGRLDKRYAHLRVSPHLGQTNLVETAHGGEPALVLCWTHAQLRRARVPRLHFFGRARRGV